MNGEDEIQARIEAVTPLNVEHDAPPLWRVTVRLLGLTGGLSGEVEFYADKWFDPDTTVTVTMTIGDSK